MPRPPTAGLQQGAAWLAGLAFLATAGLKVWTTLDPPGCLHVLKDRAGNDVLDEGGNPILDPLYPWLWIGSRWAILLEASVALLLLLPRTRRLGARAGAVFVLLAAAVLGGLSLYRGRDLTEMCGCFGPLRVGILGHLAVDAVLLWLLLAVLRLGRPVAAGEPQPSRPTMAP